MQKEAAWLLRELTGLVTRGVLDEAAAARLRAHYAQAAGSASRLGWGMILLAVGGAALIGLGIVLIFAHNWENWTPEIRVALSLLPLLIGQLAAAYALRSGSRAWSEAAGIFTAIAIGASIALIAQTYQFGGDLPRFLLVWLLLAVPLVYLLHASAVATLCWLLTLGWVFASRHGGWWGQEGALQEALRLPVFLVLFALPLPHLIRQIRLDRAGSRVAWMLRVALVAVVAGLAFTAGHEDFDALFPIYAALAAAAALAGQRYFSDAHGAWGNPLLAAGRAGVFIIVLSLSTEQALRGLDWPQSTLMLLPLVFGAAALWLAWKSFREGDRLVAPLLGALTPLAYVLPRIGDTQTGIAIVLAHLYALALAAAYIRMGLRQSELALANIGVALIAALVLLRFFDSDLSYVVRGVGFIVTGAGFFGATLWLRRRLREAAA